MSIHSKMFYKDNHIEIYNQDCRSMAELPDESVQCVVTSPPYWGLRKYSGEQELIWGDKDCGHKWDEYKAEFLHENRQGLGSSTVSPKIGIHGKGVGQASFCSLCGAWKGSYGLEPTPEMYIEHTIEILREIKRVLRKDGVVFWNIGDSYNGSTPNQTGNHGYKDGRSNRDKRFSVGGVAGLKPKDLCLIPFRVALAAQGFATVGAKEILYCADYLKVARETKDWDLVENVETILRIWSNWAFLDGWWDRSVIIWSKPNPMPESVTDRPTESHEYILMLTKSKKYYWDADAVREKNTDPLRTNFVSGKRTHGINEDRNDNDLGERSKDFIANGRNIRSVWEFPTQPYPEAHFAVFPEKLPEICIKAATPEVGCCSKCGAPWERVTKPTAEYGELLGKDWNIQEKDKAEGKIAGHHRKHNAPSVTAQYETLSWQPTCKCNADKVPSICLDPFMGAGTTLWVAKKLNRRAVGYEISEEYCQLAVERMKQQVMF